MKKKRIKQLVETMRILAIQFATSFVTVFFISTICILIFDLKYDETDVKHYKEIVYDIYNSGLQKELTNGYNSYSSLKVKSPSGTDMDVLYTKGLKEVSYPDLMELEIDYGTMSKICFKENKFKIYKSFIPSRYLEISVEPENAKDIKRYEYKICINFKKVIVKDISVALISSLVIILLSIIILQCEKLDNKNNQ